MLTTLIMHMTMDMNMSMVTDMPMAICLMPHATLAALRALASPPF